MKSVLSFELPPSIHSIQSLEHKTTTFKIMRMMTEWIERLNRMLKLKTCTIETVKSDDVENKAARVR